MQVSMYTTILLHLISNQPTQSDPYPVEIWLKEPGVQSIQNISASSMIKLEYTADYLDRVNPICTLSFGIVLNFLRNHRTDNL